jgi:hypothetical protein
MDLKVTRENTQDNFSKILNLVEHLVDNDFDNFDIELEDDVSKYSKEDFLEYKKFLTGLAGIVIRKFANNKRIAINILTDIFVVKSREINSNFTFCKNCPCMQCKQDKRYFKKTTGDEFIPPEQYCQKAFIELEISRYINETLELGINLSDLDWECYKDFIYMIYATELIHGGEYGL